MQIYIKGKKNKINLTKNHFVSQGGEGKIFARHGTVYKIYTNPKSMIQYSKMKELSIITNPNVIKPEQIVLSNKQKPIGYTMKHIANTYALCQIFPKAFRDRTGMNTKNVLHLVQKTQSTISDIHKLKILLVDGNEMNFLVDKNFKDIFFIDVDSYQTQSFPATAIMDSIRDRHNSTFSELTDWFSFGIVTFQMFIGIHPYKGRHPTVKGMDDRMKANIPVFHKDVRLPKVCLPFDTIPQAYKDWYKAIFFEGKRLNPPNDPVQIIAIPVTIQTILGNEDFEIKEIFEYNSNIIKFTSIDGNRVVITKNNFYLNNKSTANLYTRGSHAAIIPVTDKVIYTKIDDDNKLNFYNLSDDEDIFANIQAEDIMSYKGRIYIKNQDIISEIKFINMGKHINPVPHHIGNIMENATKLYDGVVIQNVLGSFVVSVFPETETHYQIQCPEFTGYQLIDAKYQDNVLMIIGSKKGKYDKFILKFNSKFSSYSFRKVGDITYYGINFTVLDNGIVIHINENEEIEIFSNKKDSNTVKIIDSSVISGDMKLFNDGIQVIFAKGKKMYRLKMNKV